MAVIEQALEGKFKNQQVADLLHSVNRYVAAGSVDMILLKFSRLIFNNHRFYDNLLRVALITAIKQKDHRD